MIIRLLQPGDCRAAEALTRSAPGAARWPLAEYERVARGQAGESGQAASASFCLVAESDRDAPAGEARAAPAGEMAGLLAASRAGDEGEIQNLVVTEARRRRGIAEALLKEAIGRLKAAGVRTVWLEVRESNVAAIRFYEKHGFRLAGRRRGYYQEPPEDALLYSRPAD